MNNISNIEDIFKSQRDYDNDVDNIEQINTCFLLAFNIKQSAFCVSFENVKEILNYHPFTEYPQNIKGHLGVLNFRGLVIPIINPFHHKIEINCANDMERYKYLVFEDNNANLVGIMVEDIRKIEVVQDLIDNVSSYKIIQVNNQAIRYMDLSYLLKEYSNE